MIIKCDRLTTKAMSRRPSQSDRERILANRAPSVHDPSPFNPQIDPNSQYAASEPNDQSTRYRNPPAFDDDAQLQKGESTDKAWYKETYKTYGKSVTKNNEAAIAKASKQGIITQDFARRVGKNKPESKIDAPNDWDKHMDPKQPKYGGFVRHTHGNQQGGYDSARTKRSEYSGNMHCPSSKRYP